MSLAFIDWFIIALFLVISLGIGIYYTKKASKDTTHFFLGGRNLPWWLAGTSMVATTFAADTPLLVTEIVAYHGISGNWLWWNGLIGGMLATFFFAKLWRNAHIITDLEFIELRYTGTQAAFLRGFKAIYLGVFMNAIVIAWVNVALGALLQVFFNIPENQIIYYLAMAMLFVMVYSSLSGLLGVVATDFIQFLVAMLGTVILAVIVLNSEQIGGIEGLKDKLPEASFNFLPNINWIGADLSETGQTLSISIATFFAFIGFQWWASWYPGAEPGGGGYIAQRMMSTKKGEDAVKATLLFQILHYAIRPLPWILVGLSTIYLYPELSNEDKKLGYVMAMKDFLPTGLKGLLLAAFFAAYTSTISTQLNWGSSYIINDLYARFIKPSAQNKELVWASRISTLILTLIALVVTSQLQTLKGAFSFMITAGAGLGAVLILRWYWWRINAWSEITATVAPIIAYAFCKFYLTSFNEAWDKPIDEDPRSFFFIIIFTTIAWITVTFLTKPTPLKHLQDFYKRVKPEGAWKKVRISLNQPSKPSKIGWLFLAWLSAILLGYSTLFLVGELVFMQWKEAGMYVFVLAFALVSLSHISKKIKIFEEE